jgi:hypothetical protein
VECCQGLDDTDAKEVAEKSGWTGGFAQTKAKVDKVLA